MYIILRIFFLFLIINPVVGQADWQDYGQVASHNGTNIEKLAKDITASFESQEEKAQAIYYWVTHNISYDFKMYEKMKKSKKDKKKYSKKELKEKQRQDVTKTLKKKKGVCQQYSNVYQALCEAVGIQCVIITGYAKANPEKSGLGEKHAWNGVYLSGNWYLLDPTFGAGYINDEKKFIFSFDPMYFLSNPISFKMNHLPTQSKWQLTEEMISKEDYKNNPGIGSGYYKYEIEMPSPNSFRVKATRDESLVLSFSSPQDLKKLTAVNLRKSTTIPSDYLNEGGRYSIVIATDELKSGTYGIFEGQELLFSYRISIN